MKLNNKWKSAQELKAISEDNSTNYILSSDEITERVLTKIEHAIKSDQHSIVYTDALLKTTRGKELFDFQAQAITNLTKLGYTVEYIEARKPIGHLKVSV